METYIQNGIVHDEKTAEEYIKNKIKWNFATTELLSVKLAYESAEAERLEELEELEEILEASRIPMEQRDAVRKMGSRFVKTIEKLDLEINETGIYKEYVTARKGKNISHSCVYGVFCSALGIELEEALEHYLYAQTSAMVTNCVKTIPLSQSVGQKLLSRRFFEFQEVLETLKTQTKEELCLSAPGFDIRGIQHEKLYSRLYMS